MEAFGDISINYTKLCGNLISPSPSPPPTSPLPLLPPSSPSPFLFSLSSPYFSPSSSPSPPPTSPLPLPPPGSLASSDLFYDAYSPKGLSRQALCPCAGSPETLTVSLRRSAKEHSFYPYTLFVSRLTHVAQPGLHFEIDGGGGNMTKRRGKTLRLQARFQEGHESIKSPPCPL